VVTGDKEEPLMRAGRHILLYLLSVATISFGVLVSFQYYWPDFVHVNYGFPFIWITHTTITIAGPVDKWNINLVNLFLDIAIWLLVSHLFYLASLWIASRAIRQN
jgi:hypothetical protein